MVEILDLISASLKLELTELLGETYTKGHDALSWTNPQKTGTLYP